MSSDIALVVGLGNPGPRFAATRHNIGFRVVDALVGRHGVTPAPFAEGWGGRLPDGVWIAKPGLFMNRSGVATSGLLAVLALEPARMLVVVDDVDLPLGTIRLRPSGGPGTHNGLRDVVDNVGPGFPRLRVGVRGADPWDDLAAYVLSDFPPDEADLVGCTLARAADAVECAVAEGLAVAMNRFNRRPDPPQTATD